MSTTTAPACPDAAPAHHAGHAGRRRTPLLALGALGVVFGDIGTSPLYAFKESMKAATHGGAPVGDAAVGVVSLVLWAVMAIVTLKYVVLILRADNRGEGGTLTLMALAIRSAPRTAGTCAVLGILGAALFYGDAVITPAISVLSAMEGLKLVAPSLAEYVIPGSVAVLVALFAMQSWGTAAVARWFGPVMALWFVLIALAAVPHVIAEPRILAALDPTRGLSFLLANGGVAFLALGSVFLAVTGGEALYADMGHFGRAPIRLAWTFLVLPALALNYLGQGALVLSNPEAVENPFFLLFPGWALAPVVALATLATVIASQAVISGAYSLTQQAVQLGLLPRMAILRTSATERGQIYVPGINWVLLALVLLLVALFRSSDALAAAYGIAVTGTMVVTAVLAYLVARHHWGWHPWAAAATFAPFLALDLVFLAANSAKVFEGGWLPLLLAAALVTTMVTWRRGVVLLRKGEEASRMPLEDFVASMRGSSVARVNGTAVFMTPYPGEVPAALLHNLKHNKVLHEKNVIMTVRIEDTPWVDPGERASLEELPDGFARATLRFGYMEAPDVPNAIPSCRRKGFRFDPMKTSYFVSRRTLRASARSRMPAWQDRMFVALSRTALDSARHFRLPPDRAVEIGMTVEI